MTGSSQWQPGGASGASGAWGRWLPALVLLGAVAAAAAVRVAVELQMPMPFCILRTATGLPCPGCGCTRSVLALTHFDLASALRFNPLFCALCLLLPGWAALGLAEWCTRRSWLPPLAARAQAWPVWRVVAVLAALNWVYLILTLPR